MLFRTCGETMFTFVGFEVTAVVMQSAIFWDITPYSPLKVNRRFGRTCLRLQNRRISQARNRREACGKQSLLGLLFDP
jgi:hypothetical protein